MKIQIELELQDVSTLLTWRACEIVGKSAIGVELNKKVDKVIDKILDQVEPMIDKMSNDEEEEG